MTRAFCTRGERECVKGTVHAAGVVLAGMMAAYNIAAWCYRREQHLGINAVVYSLAVLWEIKQTAHHVATDNVDAHPARRQARRLLHFREAAA
jgi:hypothetical protein